MARLAAFDACIFDMDGVLADSMRQHHRAYAQVLEPLGAEVSRAMVFQREGMNSRHVVREILQEHGVPVSDEEAARLGERKQAAFRAMGKPPLMRGAERTIGALRSAGLKLGVVTGSSRENLEHILGSLARQFEVRLADGDYRQQKPDPEPYLSAAVQLKVQPARCVVIENAVLGIRSAVGAGMACIALPSTMPVEVLREAGAHAIAGSLEEAAGLVLGGEGFKRRGPIPPS